MDSVTIAFAGLMGVFVLFAVALRWLARLDRKHQERGTQ